MLAPKNLPAQFDAWNWKHRAPSGRMQWPFSRFQRFFPEPTRLRLRGPFSLQHNSRNRIFEYPWAWSATPLTPGLRVLEIGGGLSGFQFILDQAGCSVVNVDPGMEAKGKGFPCDQTSMAKLNKMFGTSVELKSSTIEEANLPAESFDRVFSISVIEHLAEAEGESVMRHAYACLKPGGYFILTVDLFLDLAPFTKRERNEWGNNANLKNLLDAAPFKMVQGNPAQLNGFPEFDREQIQSHLNEFCQGEYPVLVQCLVLQK